MRLTFARERVDVAVTYSGEEVNVLSATTGRASHPRSWTGLARALCHQLASARFNVGGDSGGGLGLGVFILLRRCWSGPGRPSPSRPVFPERGRSCTRAGTRDLEVAERQRCRPNGAHRQSLIKHISEISRAQVAGRSGST